MTRRRRSVCSPISQLTLSKMSPLPPFTLDPSSVNQALFVLDRLGVVVFALSGATLGIQKRFDLFGVMVLGCVTAVGGGSIRDVLSGVTPPGFLRNETTLWIAIASSVLAFFLSSRLSQLPDRERRRWLERPMLIFDTLGLAVFAVSGALSALQLGYGFLGVVFIGTLTGVGGGIIRDLLAGEVPSILYRDIYATAASLGALVVFVLHDRLPLPLVQLLGISSVVILRYIAIRRKLSLAPTNVELEEKG